MSIDPSSGEDRTRPKLPATLNRRQLTIALLLITLVPVSVAVTMWFGMPPGKEPVLNATVAVGPATWPSQPQSAAGEGLSATKLLPCVLLANPTQEQWGNVSIAINSQFFYYHPHHVVGGENLSIPLHFFRTKGNQPFVPDQHSVKLITVYAQLPSKARAILDVRTK